MKVKYLAYVMSSAMLLTACGGSSGGSGGKASENWVGEVTGEVDKAGIETVVLPELTEGCEAALGQFMVSGGFYGKYYLWLWDDDNNTVFSKWPGYEITNNAISKCPIGIHTYTFGEENVASTTASSITSLENLNVIVNDGNGIQTADGNKFTSDKPCLKMTGPENASFVTARECGVKKINEQGEVVTETVANTVYVKANGSVVADGGTLKIQQKEGVAGSESIKINLYVSGVTVSEETKGVYWFDDKESDAKEFVNGQEILIGKEVDAVSGDKTGELHVKNTADDGTVVTATYKIVKSYTNKNDDCRLNKQDITLGAIYTSSSTTFRIWSPNSSDVKLDVGGESYTLTKANDMCYSDTYEVVVNGDLAGQKYQFTIGGKKVRDPYGRMVALGDDTANIVMDLATTNLADGWADTPALKNREDSIVYEVHVRDFTIDETSGVDADKRGRYLGMVQTGTTYQGVKTGIDHLKELGVTHVQLQPIYDFKTCANIDSQDDSCYNWGYDPWNYNVPEERYSTAFNSEDYATRIKEVKEMINEFHKNGIRVIMDVVYNHTYDKTVFKDISGKYYLDKDLTGCGNTVNADQNMVWMMIRDSMDYWVNEFHVDGFRLDLVGSFSTKDYSDWGVYLNKAYPDANLLIYGEPWAADSDAAELVVDNPVRTGRMFTASNDAHVGAFNNRIRNCLKGSSDNADALGFIFNKENDGWDGNGSDENGDALKGNMACVFMGLKAGVRSDDAPKEVNDQWSAQGFADPEQTISYITAHDNLALRDKIEAAGNTGDEAKTLQVYANSILATSQGINFIHGGEEIGRTKAAAGKDIANTYNTTTGANDFKWDLKAGEWKSVFESYASYIKMRNEHPAFRMTTADLINKNVVLNDASTDEVVIVDINGAAVSDSWSKIRVVLNSTDSAYSVSGLDGYRKVADGKIVGDSVAQDSSAVAHSVSIWAIEATRFQ